MTSKTTPSALLELRDIHKVYTVGSEEVRALDGIDLSMNSGEYIAIMGASGSGKSTLMNLLGCLDTPTSGSYRLNGIGCRGAFRRRACRHSQPGDRLCVPNL